MLRCGSILTKATYGIFRLLKCLYVFKSMQIVMVTLRGNRIIQSTVRDLVQLKNGRRCVLSSSVHTELPMSGTVLLSGEWNATKSMETQAKQFT